MVVDARLEHPFRMVVSGVSRSGKTNWVGQLLENKQEMIKPAVRRVIYFYQMWQPKFNFYKQNGFVDDFVKGVPDEKMFERKAKYGSTLFIIDDAMSEKHIDKKMDKIFTISRHMDSSIIFLTQNFFHSNMRTITRNACYFVFMENERDKGQISTFASQIGRGRLLVSAYNDATKELFSYLFVDLKPGRDKISSTRAKMFPHEKPMVVYLPVES